MNDVLKKVEVIAMLTRLNWAEVFIKMNGDVYLRAQCVFLDDTSLACLKKEVQHMFGDCWDGEVVDREAKIVEVKLPFYSSDFKYKVRDEF